MKFLVGSSYARSDVLSSVGLDRKLKGGPWFTGYHFYEGVHYIFCGVESAGRTGHNYGNYFEGDDLIWRGKTGSKLVHATIRSLLDPQAVIRVFYRHDERARFTYAGQARAAQTWDEVPVRVRWSFADDPDPHAEFLPEEVAPGEAVREGARKTVTVNVYERDPTARDRCIDRWKAECFVCGFRFEDRYGELGKGFIHVHHLRPLHEIGEEYVLSPEDDLRPVCPNCHAMLHRRRPALSIDELKMLLR